jgi:hypothetical protein
MANLGQNSLWTDVQSKSSNATTSVMGPSYSYADNIQGPASMGVGSQGTFSQIGTNSGAITNYVNYMISGPALGNRFFVNTGGTCTDSSQTVQSRFNYINNVSDGADVLPDAMKQDLGGIASDFNGLLPGMLQDLEGLNPLHLMGAIAADSEPTCDCYTCEITGGTESHFLNVDLTPDFDSSLCTKVDNSVCGKTTEGFSEIPAYAIVLGLVAIFIALK